jgi:hypothetical protein
MTPCSKKHNERSLGKLLPPFSGMRILDHIQPVVIKVRKCQHILPAIVFLFI